MTLMNGPGALAPTQLDTRPRRSLLNLLATQIEFRMSLVIIVVMAVLSLISPYFLTVNNLLNLLDQSVVVGSRYLANILKRASISFSSSDFKTIRYRFSRLFSRLFFLSNTCPALGAREKAALLSA